MSNVQSAKKDFFVVVVLLTKKSFVTVVAFEEIWAESESANVSHSSV